MELILRGDAKAWSGSGSGYGDGDGDGYGYGYGDGSGYGYGDGDGYWPATIEDVSDSWSDAQRARMKRLRKDGARVAYWRSDPNGMPANGGRSKVAAHAGLIEEIEGPLHLCSRGLHATLQPDGWAGSRWWVVALIGEVVGDDHKMAALKREIIGEAVFGPVNTRRGR